MKKRLSWLVATAGLCGVPGTYLYRASTQKPRFTFAVLADQDYGAAATVPPYAEIARDMRETYELTIQQINNSGADFAVHLGDMQLPRYGNCSKQNYLNRRALLNSFSMPLIFNPGDNDWSDFKGAPECPNNPLENLALLRSLWYPTNQSLGGSTITLERQPGYPENQRWYHKGLLCTTFHTIGSNNIIKGGTLSEEERLEEYTKRQAAAIRWIKESFTKAREMSVQAVLLFTHADRWKSYFTEGSDDIFGLGNAIKPTFEKLMNVILEETASFAEGEIQLASSVWPVAKKHVYLFYGDSHTFMAFRPLTRSFHLPKLEFYHLPYYMEIQVPGPGQGWVEVDVDFSNSQPLGFRVHDFATVQQAQERAAVSCSASPL